MNETERVSAATLMAYIQSTPWDIEPGYMNALVDSLFSADSASVVSRRAAPTAPKVGTKPKTIAVVPMHGVLVHRLGPLSAFFGDISTEKWGRMYDELMVNPNIEGVAVSIASPGGEVSYLEELATKIFQWRGTKPVVAVANTWAASAAYRIGTAFDVLVCTPSGEVGSIGTWTKHLDYSGALEKEGVKTTIVQAGQFKTEFSPYAPLSKEAKAELQAGVDHYYGMFVKGVAKHRGVTAATVKETYGKGRMVRAGEAFGRGMVDGIATLDQVVGWLSSGRNPLREAELQASELQLRDMGVGSQPQSGWRNAAQAREKELAELEKGLA